MRTGVKIELSRLRFGRKAELPASRNEPRDDVA